MQLHIGFCSSFLGSEHGVVIDRSHISRLCFMRMCVSLFSGQEWSALSDPILSMKTSPKGILYVGSAVPVLLKSCQTCLAITILGSS